MSNESTNIIETMSAELEHLRPMESSLEMAEADVKAYKQRIAVLEKEVERLQRYHDAEATKWIAENQKLKDEANKVIAEKDAKILRLIEDWNRLYKKYNKFIKLKQEFCDKFKDIELEITK